MERQVAEQGFKSKKENFKDTKPKQERQNLPEKKDIKEKIEVKETVVEKKEEPKKEEKIETKTEIKSGKKVIKKEFACVYGRDLPLSYKTSGAVCRFIKNKNPQDSIKQLEQVAKIKLAIPFRGEIPHRAGFRKGYARGRYPEKAASYFIQLLKSLISNAKTNGLDHEKIKVVIAKADKASSPTRGTRMAYGRKKFKRANIYIEVREKEDKINKKKENKNNKSALKKIEAQSKAHSSK